VRRRLEGFSYIGLMVLVALLALTAAAASAVWSVAAQRERERELLFIGRQYIQALEMYRRAVPAAPPGSAYPKDLQPLLADPRALHARRFLRQLYADPMTGQADWLLLRDGSGGIVGLHSRSARKPIKTSGFPPGLDFASAKSYREWEFRVREPEPAASAAVASR